MNGFKVSLSFAPLSYHFALYGDSIKTSREMGHLNGDDVLFSYYRKLVSQTKGQQYFDILV